MTKKSLNDRIPYNVNWEKENFAAIRAMADKNGISFALAANLIVRDWRRVNPTSVIKIGGNDHEPAN